VDNNGEERPGDRAGMDSTQITRAEGKLAFENSQKIIALKNNIEKDFMVLASLLITNHDNQYYKILGYDTWEEFLAIPEISMSRSFAYKIMQVYRIWVIKYGVSQENLDIDNEKLFLASIQATEENYKEWLEKARVLSRSDIRGLLSGEDYEYTVTCPNCNFKFKP